MRIIIEMTNSRIARWTKNAANVSARMTMIKAQGILRSPKSRQLNVADIASALRYQNPGIKLFGRYTQDCCSAPHPSPTVVDIFFTQRFRSRKSFSTFSFVSPILERVRLAPGNIALFLTVFAKCSIVLMVRVRTFLKFIKALALSTSNADFSLWKGCGSGLCHPLSISGFGQGTA